MNHQQKPKTIFPQVETRVVVVRNPDGLHLRGATLLVQKAQTFSANITLSCDGIERPCDGKSVLEVLVLGANCGTEITICASGHDALAAVEHLAQHVAEFEE